MSYHFNRDRRNLQISASQYKSEDEISRNRNAPAFPGFPQSYIIPPSKYNNSLSVVSPSPFYDAVLSANSEQRVEQIEFKSYSDYGLSDLESYLPIVGSFISQFKITGQIGYQVELSRYRLTHSYYDSRSSLCKKRSGRIAGVNLTSYWLEDAL